MGLGFLKHIEYLATSDSSLHGASLTRCGSKVRAHQHSAPLKCTASHLAALLLMIEILHYLRDPKPWELWSIFLIVDILRDLYHPPYQITCSGHAPCVAIVYLGASIWFRSGSIRLLTPYPHDSCFQALGPKDPIM